MLYLILITLTVFVLYAGTRPTILVLKYHHVNPMPESNLSYMPETFEAQLAILTNLGYSCISLGEMYQQLYKTRRVKKKQFVITFDDGFLDNYLYAYPILKKLNLKASIFLTTANIVEAESERTVDTAVILENNQAFLDALKNRYDSFLNWKEIAAMHHSGLIDFQPHGHYHRYIYISDKIEYYSIGEKLATSFKLRSLEDPHIQIGADVYDSGPSLAYKKYDPYKKSKETDWQAYKRFVDEIGTSKHCIEEKLEKECHFFAWPFGKFSQLSLQAAKYLGLTLICTSNPGANTVFTNHSHIKRFNPSLDPVLFTKQIKKYSNPIAAMFHR